MSVQFQLGFTGGLHNKTTSSPLKKFHIEQDIITYQASLRSNIASKFDIFTDKSIPKILIAIRVKLTRHCEKIFEICNWWLRQKDGRIEVLDQNSAELPKMSKNQKLSKSEHWNGTIYKIEISYFCWIFFRAIARAPLNTNFPMLHGPCIL